MKKRSVQELNSIMARCDRFSLIFQAGQRASREVDGTFAEPRTIEIIDPGGYRRCIQRTPL
jgi:hypothetical protein